VIGVRGFSCGVAAVGVAGLFFAWPTTGGGQAPSFPTEAELVTIDVVVLDADGKPVPDLRREDFRILEDGRPQALAAFEKVEAVLPPPAQRPLRGGPARTAATNVGGPPTHRTFAFVFDDLHIGPLNAERAKAEVLEFVNRESRPGDRLLLVTASDGRFWSTTLGASDARWTEALSRVRSQESAGDSPAARMTHWEAMRIASFGDERLSERVARRRMLAVGCEPDPMASGGVACIGGACCSGRPGRPGGCSCLNSLPGAEETYSLQSRRLDQTLRTLLSTVEHLEPIRGRKAVVLLSEGFILDPTRDEFRTIRAYAARANVVVHFVDARGLPVGPEFLSATVSRGSIPAQDIGPTLAAWKLEDDGTETLAAETGGLTLQTNDTLGALEQVAREFQVTYLLGFEPTNRKRDGGFRKVRVEVDHPGLQVRARAGYFARSAKEAPTPSTSPLTQAQLGFFDADGIPLRLAAYLMGPAPLKMPTDHAGVEVLLAGEVRLDALHSTQKDGRRVAEPKFSLLTGSRHRESHESTWTLEMALSDAAAAASEAWHPFTTRIVMGEGDHRAKLVVESGDRIGSVTLDFLVPGDGERISTPILSDQLVASAGDRRVMPIVRRSFNAGGTLQCWVELYGAAEESATLQPRVTAAFVAR